MNVSKKNMDEADLLAVVRQLKITQPAYSSKEVHQALLTAGTAVAFSHVKKACGKVTKVLAQEHASAEEAASNKPALVAVSPSSVAFLRCQSCERRVPVRVCAGCYCVSYCSSACLEKDSEHITECSSYARHFQRDVSVNLPGDPAWIRTAMHHRGDMELCDLLQTLGLHDGTYSLLCGCVHPSSPHRYVPNPAGLPSEPITGAEIPSNWNEYYTMRQLPTASAASLLLSWPLTVFHALSLVGLLDETSRPVRIHYLGPEKEVMFLPLFRELALLLPASTLVIEMVGPLGIPLPDPIRFEGRLGGSVAISVTKGLYHELELPEPDVAIAPNAGLAVAGCLHCPNLTSAPPLDVCKRAEHSQMRVICTAITPATAPAITPAIASHTSLLALHSPASTHAPVLSLTWSPPPHPRVSTHVTA